MMLLSLLLACSGGTDKETGGDIVGDATAGADVYASTCAGCHGADGEGGTGPAMTEEVPEQSDAELEDIIINGEGSMAGFGDTLSEQEIADVIAYLRETFGG